MAECIYSLPLVYAKIAAIIIFLSMVAVAWLLPYEFVVKGAPDTNRWRDLRIWATLLTAIQLVIYYIF